MNKPIMITLGVIFGMALLALVFILFLHPISGLGRNITSTAMKTNNGTSKMLNNVNGSKKKPSSNQNNKGTNSNIGTKGNNGTNDGNDNNDKSNVMPKNAIGKNKASDAQLAKQMVNYEYNYVNQIRAKYHLHKLTPSKDLDKISKVRSGQVYYAYNNLSEDGSDVHGCSKHQTMWDDAKKMGIKSINTASWTGENASILPCPQGLDASPLTARTVGTPAQIAKANIDDLMYHDQLSMNGHRKNILSKDYTHMALNITLHRNAKGKFIGTMVQNFSD